MLDLDATETKVRDEHHDCAHWMSDLDCSVCGIVLPLITALRAVLDTTAEELADEVFREWPLLGPNELAKATMDYLKNKAGVTV